MSIFGKPCLIIRTRECYKFADAYLPKLQFAWVWGKYLSALPANFSLFDLSFPLCSSYYSCLASSLVLTVFFGSRRICHCEGDDESPLITPCHCTGSLRFVHQSCLQQWIKSSDTRCCELCKYEFIMETKLKPLRKVRRSLYVCVFVWSGTWSQLMLAFISSVSVDKFRRCSSASKCPN